MINGVWIVIFFTRKPIFVGGKDLPYGGNRLPYAGKVLPVCGNDLPHNAGHLPCYDKYVADGEVNLTSKEQRNSRRNWLFTQNICCVYPINT